MSVSERVLGVDVGSSKMSVSLWDVAGRRLEARRFATFPGGPEPNIREIVRVGRELAAGGSIGAIGVSAGGPVDPEAGRILSIPNSPGWERVAIGPELSRALGAACAVENDANAGALAEWRFGAGRGARDLAFLTLSTGIGAGLILDGRLYRGHRFLAGEAGHQVIVPGGAPCGCGGRGCLEAYASGAGMARRLAELRRDDPALPASAREVVARARAGDLFSVAFLHEVAGYLAHGLANLVYLLNPRRIILGTIAVGAGDLLLGPLREDLDRRLWPPLREGLEVLPAGLGAEIGDHAAFAAASRG